jgi:hypothetical protein
MLVAIYGSKNFKTDLVNKTFSALEMACKQVYTRCLQTRDYNYLRMNRLDKFPSFDTTLSV